MKEPLEKQLEESYKIYKKDHEHLRQSLAESITDRHGRGEQNTASQRTGISLGEIIMNSKLLKIAAGLIIVGIIAAAFNYLTGSGSITAVAFGDVLERIRNSSYTFDMTTITEGEVQGTNKCMLLQPGIVRFDSPGIMGGLTSISNFATGEGLIIFHGQKTAARMEDILSNVEIPSEVENIPDDFGPSAIFVGQIENLWNLQDGTETPLGEEEIDGQPAIGFKVEQRMENIASDIIVWANKQTGTPIRVEIITFDPENSSDSTTEVIDNFDLDAELDPELFSMEPPQGYTMAYQKTLDETIQNTDSSAEAEKVIQSINLWESGQEDEAVETMLSVDWTLNIEFSGEVYFFTMSENGYVQLNSADQQKVMQEIMNTSGQIGRLSRKMWELAQTAISEQEYEIAENYLTATLEMGRLINRNTELTYTAQMIGHSQIRKSLIEMEKLYTASGQQEKLEQVRQDLKEIDAEIEDLKERINNMFGG